MIYELITLKPFFENIDFYRLVKKIVNDEARPEFDDDTPVCFKELIKSQNPEERPEFSKIEQTHESDERFNNYILR